MTRQSLNPILGSNYEADAAGVSGKTDVTSDERVARALGLTLEEYRKMQKTVQYPTSENRSGGKRRRTRKGKQSRRKQSRRKKSRRKGRKGKQSRRKGRKRRRRRTKKH